MPPTGFATKLAERSAFGLLGDRRPYRLNPAIREMVAEAKSRFRPVPDTSIPNDRFNALIDRLKQIDETDDEARDKAIQFALPDVGQIAPESSRSYYE